MQFPYQIQKDTRIVHTHHSSCRGATVRVRHSRFCRPSGLPAARHPCWGNPLKFCRRPPSACHHFRSADWPLTEGRPKRGAPAASRGFSGPPSFPAAPWNMDGRRRKLHKVFDILRVVILFFIMILNWNLQILHFRTPETEYEKRRTWTHIGSLPLISKFFFLLCCSNDMHVSNPHN